MELATQDRLEVKHCNGKQLFVFGSWTADIQKNMMFNGFQWLSISGSSSQLTHIFQRGSNNHQPDIVSPTLKLMFFGVYLWSHNFGGRKKPTRNSSCLFDFGIFDFHALFGLFDRPPQSKGASENPRWTSQSPKCSHIPSGQDMSSFDDN